MLLICAWFTNHAILHACAMHSLFVHDLALALGQGQDGRCKSEVHTSGPTVALGMCMTGRPGLLKCLSC